ncbi:DNA uptake protein ComE [Psychroflexus halocasei]|uniref:DNA uptake protein ComE n=2 Tax=Flavobacteriaceae TaxID=49546 RepID=A0A1H4C4L9_9FLAO|nr:DNA uptake protein ComE [Psychroflexus halocasei]
MSKTDRNGILIFIGILIIGCVGIYLVNTYSKPKDIFQLDKKAQDRMNVLLDSLKKEQNKPYVPKIYPFNPNFITDEKSYRLEMKPAEYDKLKAYREADQWINSVEDFQKVTGVSQTWLNKYSKYFKFPDWVIEQQARERENRRSQPSELSYTAKKDLNKVEADDLTEISGIGSVLSQRILRYRNKIGGFRGDSQLKDIYGLKAELEAKILAKMTVKSGNEIPRININKASVIELADVPYFDYELAREINTFIKLRGGIESFEELSKIQDFKAYQIPQLKLYLKLKENE